MATSGQQADNERLVEYSSTRNPAAPSVESPATPMKQAKRSQNRLKKQAQRREQNPNPRSCVTGCSQFYFFSFCFVILRSCMVGLTDSGKKRRRKQQIRESVKRLREKEKNRTAKLPELFSKVSLLEENCKQGEGFF